MKMERKRKKRIMMMMMMMMMMMTRRRRRRRRRKRTFQDFPNLTGSERQEGLAESEDAKRASPPPLPHVLGGATRARTHLAGAAVGAGPRLAPPHGRPI